MVEIKNSEEEIKIEIFPLDSKIKDVALSDVVDESYDIISAPVMESDIQSLPMNHSLWFQLAIK